jgi:hypothetical protein
MGKRDDLTRIAHALANHAPRIDIAPGAVVRLLDQLARALPKPDECSETVGDLALAVGWDLDRACEGAGRAFDAMIKAVGSGDGPAKVACPELADLAASVRELAAAMGAEDEGR